MTSPTFPSLFLLSSNLFLLSQAVLFLGGSLAKLFLILAPAYTSLFVSLIPSAAPIPIVDIFPPTYKLSVILTDLPSVTQFRVLGEKILLESYG